MRCRVWWSRIAMRNKVRKDTERVLMVLCLATGPHKYKVEISQLWEMGGLVTRTELRWNPGQCHACDIRPGDVLALILSCF